MKAISNYVPCILWCLVFFSAMVCFFYLVFNIDRWIDAYNNLLLVNQMPPIESYAGW